MTLVELLVVAVIVTILISSAIPVLSPAGDDRLLREGSREVNAYLSAAQSRAIQTGRPQGVMLKRLSVDTLNGEDNGVCIELLTVEAPPPYAGFTSGSLCRVARRIHPTAPYLLQFVQHGVVETDDRLPRNLDHASVPPRFLRPGDEVTVFGAHYRLLAGDGSGTVGIDTTTVRTGEAAANGYFSQPAGSTRSYAAELIEDGPALAINYDADGNEFQSVEALIASGVAPTSPYWTAGAPYKIHRQPTASPAPPLQLPTGAAIDLQASGFATSDKLYTPGHAWDDAEQEYRLATTSPMIMFAPDGSVDRIYYSRQPRGALVNPNAVGYPGAPIVSESVRENIALLIGLRDAIPAPPTELRSSTDTPKESRNDPVLLSADRFEDANLTDLPAPDYERFTRQYNWLNLDSRWVVIGGRTGTIRTVENAFVPPTFTGDFDSQIIQAQSLVREAASSGGRG
ncbi:hypothetical protein Mal64_24730 [Pseudobythopirellula maris]|uniref:Uncharacterized protein n=2 Tax=Pseudobythopirellula maris TaxID=2527991 RepID=A0A5C5ZNB6_9BACT|nr:hypothetical protein Mal64_24730 [Pseudobythopirellula maris]